MHLDWVLTSKRRSSTPFGPTRLRLLASLPLDLWIPSSSSIHRSTPSPMELPSPFWKLRPIRWESLPWFLFPSLQSFYSLVLYKNKSTTSSLMVWIFQTIFSLVRPGMGLLILWFVWRSQMLSYSTSAKKSLKVVSRWIQLRQPLGI